MPLRAEGEGKGVSWRWVSGAAEPVGFSLMMVMDVALG